MKIPALLALLLVNISVSRAAEIIESDICIYGGTSGGIAAAVQAARHGKSVSLAVFSGHLGGLTTGGLGATDVGTVSSIGGVSREFYQRIGQKYGQTERFNFEPKVARQVFLEMLSQANITPRYHQRLASVQKSGEKITQITMEDGTQLRAKMFVDATYEGDLLAMAGVSFTVGRESTAQYGESLNGIRANSNAHQFSVNVDPYVIPGDANSGLIPLVQPGNGGTPGDGDTRIQAYNYRLCFTQNAANRLPHVVPANYDPARYELLGRFLDARVAAGATLTMASFFNVGGMPNGKTDLNNNGPVSTDYIGMNYLYPTANYADRAAMDTDHLSYIQGLIHYLATSPRSPATLRAEILTWGPCADEWQETGGYSPQIYVREARRMVSDYVMIQSNCQGTRVAPDPVCMGSYTMDSHHCQRIVKNGFVVNEGDVQQAVAAPYGISYRSIIPKVGEAENLLVPFAFSASHIAFGSTRMEPVCMMAGHAAATAASVAIDDQVSVQQVSYPKLSLQLLADKQVLPAAVTALPGEIIIDNPNATFSGAWTASSATAGFYGSNYHHDGNAGQGTKTATYTPTFTAAGSYDVFLRWAAFTNRATNVPVDIIHANGTNTVTVNQQLNHNTWVKLGTFDFQAGTAGSLVIRTTGANGFVIADAAQFVPANTVVLPTVGVVAADNAAREHTGGTADKARFVFARTGDTTAPLTINYTVSGTSSGGNDYAALAGNVAIPAGQLSATLEITAVHDQLIEGDETLIVTLDALPEYTVGGLSSATATIHDSPFDAWRFIHFSEAQRANPAIAGPQADLDGDGVVNLLECWSGGTPWVVGPPILQEMRLDETGVSLMARRHVDGSGLYHLIERSADLNVWTPGQLAGSTVTTFSEAPFQTLSVPLAMNPLPWTRQFARVAVSETPFPAPPVASRAFFSFDSNQAGTGVATNVATTSVGFSNAPVIVQGGTVFVSEGGAASFTDVTGNVWLGSGNSGLPGHCLGWNPGSSGNQFSVTLDTTGLWNVQIRMDIRSAAASGGTPPTQFSSFTYNTGSGPVAVPGANLNFVADNTFREWSVNLAAVTAIQNQSQVTLTWTIESLANLPSPVESFRIDNFVITADPL